jgi:tetratricopeptide (TPR) repeat protein
VRIAVGLFAAALLLYWRTFSFGFVNWDDPEYILQNPNLALELSPAGMWWALTTTYQFYWHPWTWWSYLLDFSLYGLSPAGYHVENVLIHGAASVALFYALRALTGSVNRSAFVAALFCVHPLRVESVAWVAERKDVWSGLFWFLALWAYANYAKGLRRDYWLTLGFFVLGLMAKPMVVTLPVVLLLLDFWPLKRPEPVGKLILEKIPMLALAGAVGIITILAQQGVGATAGLEDVGVALRISNALVSYVLYLWKSIWPAGLVALYPFLPIPAWQAAGAAYPYVLTGWLWFLVTLLPVIGLTQTGAQAMADRFTYIPQVGLWIALVWGVAAIATARRIPSRQLQIAGGAVVGGLSLLTLIQTGYWQDSIVLWQHTLEIAPMNYVAHHNLAMALQAANRPAEAIQHLTETLRIRPGFADAESNLGGILAQSGKVQEAIPHLESALKTNPRSAEAHNNLGTAYGMSGRNDDALREFQASLALNPSQANTHSNLGVIYETKGMIPEALAEFRAALAIQPDNPEASRSLARLQQQLPPTR